MNSTTERFDLSTGPGTGQRLIFALFGIGQLVLSSVAFQRLSCSVIVLNSLDYFWNRSEECGESFGDQVGQIMEVALLIY